MKTHNTEILNYISMGRELVIPASDGQRLLCNEPEFQKYLSKDIKRNYSKPGVFKPRTEASVYERIADSTIMGIFQALPGTWEDRWMSQNQIRDFCKIHPKWLRREYRATMFLCKKNENNPIDEDRPGNNLFALSINFYSEEKDEPVEFVTLIHSLTYPYPSDGHAEYLHRVVAPTLVPAY